MHECRRLVGKSRTNITQIRVSYFVKWRHLVDRSYTSVAPPPLTDNSRTNTVQIRVSYFINYVKMAIGVM